MLLVEDCEAHAFAFDWRGMRDEVHRNFRLWQLILEDREKRGGFSPVSLSSRAWTSAEIEEYLP